jgi:hypothetical protein
MFCTNIQSCLFGSLSIVCLAFIYVVLIYQITYIYFWERKTTYELQVVACTSCLGWLALAIGNLQHQICLGWLALASGNLQHQNMPRMDWH